MKIHKMTARVKKIVNGKENVLSKKESRFLDFGMDETLESSSTSAASAAVESSMTVATYIL